METSWQETLDPQLIKCGSFEHPRGWELNTPVHQAPKIVVVRSGCFHSQIGNEAVLSLKSGDVICVPSGSAHYVSCQIAGGIQFVVSEPVRNQPWAQQQWDDPPMHMPNPPFFDELENNIRSLRQTSIHDDFISEALTKNVLTQIWLRIAQFCHGNGTNQGRTSAMQRWLRRHLDEPISREDLARHFSLTPEYVSALFTSECKCGPITWLRRLRIKRAIQLLEETALPIAAIAKKVGYDDQYHFSRVFKKETGIPPSHIRHW